MITSPGLAVIFANSICVLMLWASAEDSYTLVTTVPKYEKFPIWTCVSIVTGLFVRHWARGNPVPACTYAATYVEISKEPLKPISRGGIESGPIDADWPVVICTLPIDAP